MRIKKKDLRLYARTLITVTEPHSLISEQFKTLRTNIEFTSPDKKICSIVITSPSPSEGKSTTAANLAVVYAQTGKRILLIDADMRKPTMHYTFSTRNNLGLSTVLSNQSNIKDSINKTGVQGLDLLSCGPIPLNPAELLTSKAMTTLLEYLKEKYDLIIIDSPPILSVTDSQILANKCDGSILVLKAGNTHKDLAIKAKEKIISSNSMLIGVVLSNMELGENTYSYTYA